VAEAPLSISGSEVMLTVEDTNEFITKTITDEWSFCRGWRNSRFGSLMVQWKEEELGLVLANQPFWKI
jgi:hypothetical protein